jgi:hypothetical protein
MHKAKSVVKRRPKNQMNLQSPLDISDSSGAVKQEASQTFESAGKLMRKGNLETAMEHYFKAASHVTELLGDPECDRLFISISFRLSDLFSNVRKKQKEVLRILHQTQEVARRLGDERDLTLLNLHLGRIYNGLSTSSQVLLNLRGFYIIIA